MPIMTPVMATVLFITTHKKIDSQRGEDQVQFLDHLSHLTTQKGKKHHQDHRDYQVNIATEKKHSRVIWFISARTWHQCAYIFFIYLHISACIFLLGESADFFSLYGDKVGSIPYFRKVVFGIFL